MSALWDLTQEYLDDSGLSERALARRAGMTPQALNGWKHRTLRTIPHKATLEALAKAIDVPYDRVLDAALLDAGYISGPRNHEAIESREVTDPHVRRALRIITRALQDS